MFCHSADMHTAPGPFRSAEALASYVLTFHELRQFHTVVHPGVWVRRGTELTATECAQAAWLWSRRAGVLAGITASGLLGAKWVEPDIPVELIHTNRRPPPRIIVYTDQLLPAEIRTVSGLPVTTAARTAFDIGRRLEWVQAVQRIDALMNATHVTVEDIAGVIAVHPGIRGLTKLRKVLQWVDAGSESPYETLTRIILLRNGFPRPHTQVRVRNENGTIIARIDMGWPQWRVGVDFDGAHHWTDPKQRTKDIERYAILADLGWIDIRVTAEMVHNKPGMFLKRVGHALRDRGCPQTW